jgi:flagellar biosynthetic protein FliS
MRALANYRRTSVESASNEDLVVLLLEAAVQRQHNADAAMVAHDRSAWNKEIHVARAIFMELLSAFDPETPAEVLAPMAATYRWLIHHLTEAARNGDRVRLEQTLEVSGTVLDTWTRALKIHRGEEDAA